MALKGIDIFKLTQKTNCKEYIKYIYINRKYLFDMLFDLEEKI